MRIWGLDLGLRLSKPAQRELFPIVIMAASTYVIVMTINLNVVDPVKQRLAYAEAALEQAKHAQEKSQAARALYERVRLAQQQVENVMNSLPSRQEHATLAVAVSELAKTEAVMIPGMTYHIEKEEGYRPVKATLSFKVTGNYAAIYRLIHRLEAANSYLVIESLDVTRADRVNRPTLSHLVVCNMVVATFLRPYQESRESL